MLADLPSKFVWPHEDNPQERLLLDPLPQEEMNRIMLRPMFKASAGWWLGRIWRPSYGLLRRRVGLHDPLGMGIAASGPCSGVFIAHILLVGTGHSGTLCRPSCACSTPNTAARSTRRGADGTPRSLRGHVPFIHLGGCICIRHDPTHQRQIWPTSSRR
jgi:hypothetical protein